MVYRWIIRLHTRNHDVDDDQCQQIDYDDEIDQPSPFWENRPDPSSDDAFGQENTDENRHQHWPTQYVV